MTQEQKTCEQRIDESLASRIEDIRRLFEEPEDAKTLEELGSLDEYGLSFDYVEPETFEDQPDGYWRWQLSWGGPADEFRFHDGDHRIEFRFHDWGDGAGRWLGGESRKLIAEIAELYFGLTAYPIWRQEHE